METITIESLREIAQQLIDGGSHTEYVRGICELIAFVENENGNQSTAEKAIEIAKSLDYVHYADLYLR